MESIGTKLIENFNKKIKEIDNNNNNIEQNAKKIIKTKKGASQMRSDILAKIDSIKFCLDCQEDIIGLSDEMQKLEKEQLSKIICYKFNLWEKLSNFLSKAQEKKYIQEQPWEEIINILIYYASIKCPEKQKKNMAFKSIIYYLLKQKKYKQNSIQTLLLDCNKNAEQDSYLIYFDKLIKKIKNNNLAKKLNNLKNYQRDKINKALNFTDEQKKRYEEFIKLVETEQVEEKHKNNDENKEGNEIKSKIDRTTTENLIVDKPDKKEANEILVKNQKDINDTMLKHEEIDKKEQEAKRMQLDRLNKKIHNGQLKLSYANIQDENEVKDLINTIKKSTTKVETQLRKINQNNYKQIDNDEERYKKGLVQSIIKKITILLQDNYLMPYYYTSFLKKLKEELLVQKTEKLNGICCEIVKNKEESKNKILKAIKKDQKSKYKFGIITYNNVIKEIKNLGSTYLNKKITMYNVENLNI